MGLALRYLFLFELICVQDEQHGSGSVLVRVETHSPQLLSHSLPYLPYAFRDHHEENPIRPFPVGTGSVYTLW